MSHKRGQLRVGTSGYQYKHWRGRFYPKDLPQTRWFDFYAEHFDTVEINNTFYNLPSAETFDAWKEAAPKGFEYVLKFSRYGSHIKRLKEPENSVNTFLEVAKRLGTHLGPVLVQLPPRWKARPDRLADFLETAPGKVRWAFEFRDAEWLNEEVFSVLREHGAALCIHDMLDEHPRTLTADWVYLRYHGEHYTGSYSSAFLRQEASRILDWLAEGRDVYAYFNNDQAGHAVHNAQALRDDILAS
ncbi:DUF72 domain-containing protein [Litchfieldella xinjiangensis]|uniref:DUF72 domain-containing protein n=1 Tax=Litchfieldella xinjiangensis TaxID=1166948 RepID=UPI0005BE51F9|nr:DUF72 domain-containing protein [Halomonas xinjiangensis]